MGRLRLGVGAAEGGGDADGEAAGEEGEEGAGAFALDGEGGGIVGDLAEEAGGQGGVAADAVAGGMGDGQMVPIGAFGTEAGLAEPMDATAAVPLFGIGEGEVARGHDATEPVGPLQEGDAAGCVVGTAAVGEADAEVVEGVGVIAGRAADAVGGWAAHGMRL